MALPTHLLALLFFAQPAVAPASYRIADCGPFAAQPGGLSSSSELSSELDSLVVDLSRRTGALPGVAVAVVRRNRLIYARGFGFRSLSECTPTGIDTRYYLKSVTKSFLGLAVAILHEDNEIELDAPLSDYLPRLRLPDGLDPKLIPLRSHFTHTQPYWSGSLNYRTAFPGNLTEDQFVVHLSRYSARKGIGFRYSNFGPIMGAHAIAAKTGVGWRPLIRNRVFKPAQMHSSFVRMEKAKGGQLATAYHGSERNGFLATTIKHDAQMHAAGGAISTVRDTARWLIANLDRGRIDGRQVFSARAVARAHAPLVDIDWKYGEIQRFATGLGVYRGDYEGTLIMHHFGGESHVSFMPKSGWGIAIFTNNIATGSKVTHPLALSIYDRLLRKPDLPARLTRRGAEVASTLQASRKKGQYAHPKTTNQAPRSFPEAALAGRYHLGRLGEIAVVWRNGKLSARYGVLEGSLTHIGRDRYLAALSPWGMAPLPFEFRRSGHGMILDWGGRLFERSNQRQR